MDVTEFGRVEKCGHARIPDADYTVRYSSIGANEQLYKMVEDDLKSGHRVYATCWSMSSCSVQFVVLTTLAKMVERFGEELDFKGWHPLYPEVVLSLKHNNK